MRRWRRRVPGCAPMSSALRNGPAKVAADALHKAERAANLLDIAERELDARDRQDQPEAARAARRRGTRREGPEGRRAGTRRSRGRVLRAGRGRGIPGGGDGRGDRRRGGPGPRPGHRRHRAWPGSAPPLLHRRPILEAGTATKQARDALASLDPAQQAAYDSLGALKDQFAGFGKALEPQVLDLFNRGLRIASGLMADIAPVTKAVGTALGGMLARSTRSSGPGRGSSSSGSWPTPPGRTSSCSADTFIDAAAHAAAAAGRPAGAGG